MIETDDLDTHVSLQMIGCTFASIALLTEPMAAIKLNVNQMDSNIQYNRFALIRETCPINLDPL